ncbi:teneurin-m isoform X2 [Lingula anatina]|uniref:Teneurin-m isoform X1 n=1 Tax=Lingula anatina TaxID=7574 RepID=A0A1S3HIF5_LINAN|nr:teneurin-m isoform X1 [Lingula anatina]XP_013385246.1 teneurin-m isoform X2 [Lingula anatina]|eukprot:XP_013385245.1 teneurin-m isoform X1 [Lingula anatina]
MKIHIILSACMLAVSISLIEAKKYCKANADCTTSAQIGNTNNVKCIKSACDWGVCGCSHGFVLRYLGSEKLMQCVPLRKIDESCSYNDATGVCGAKNSECSNGVCKCTGSNHKMWGGEHCGTGLMPSEGLTAGDTCDSGSASNSVSGHNVLTGVPHQCMCSSASQTYLYGVMANTYNYFLGRKFPYCLSAKIGDMCITDSDCGTNMKCTNDACQCDSTNGYDYHNYAKTQCFTAAQTETTLGQSCTGKNCDGSAGLVCGDYCETNSSATAATTCQCGVGHTQSGSSCNARGVGSTCYGDANCQMIGPNARCVDGACANAVSAIAAGVMSLLLPIVLAVTTKYN